MKIKVSGKIIDIDRNLVKDLSNYYLSLSGGRYLRCIYKGAANKGKGFMFHRYVLGVHDKETPGLYVDHINCNTFDNRKKNLRLVDGTQNNLNTKYKHKNYWYNKKRREWIVEFDRYYKRTVIYVKTEKEAKKLVRQLLPSVNKKSGK